MDQKKYCFLLALLCVSILLAGKATPQEAPSASTGPSAEKPTLVQASMCASLKEGSPCNSGAVFPVSQGKVLCFSSFDPVPRKTFILHSWFHRDVLITRQKLTLSPPRWSTYSTIELRESDKGPWRVEIIDEDARLLRVLRFSITD
jgi:Protein of unknown function (DUF2914)